MWYKLEWHFDTHADSPLEAIKEAIEAFHEGAHMFQVTDEKGIIQHIDGNPTYTEEEDGEEN